MVKSGLYNQPHVSPYRLTLHLSFATFLYLGLLWPSFALQGKNINQYTHNHRLYYWSWIWLGFCVLIILSGGFMAGTKAGLLFPTFPKFDPDWYPPHMYTLTPFWLNWFENLVSIHFNHRLLALLLFLGIVRYCYRVYQTKTPNKKLIFYVLCLLGIQIILGAITVLWHVPVFIALAHQGNAFLFLSVLLYLIHSFKPQNNETE